MLNIDGWMSSNGMPRSYGDRWNTDGGRWTDERKKDDKDYVPKNARWNDEGILIISSFKICKYL